MPDWRDADLVLDEKIESDGCKVLFWRILADYRLWLRLGRGPLFWGHGIGLWRSLYPAELTDALHALEKIWFSPHLVEDSRLAEACTRIWQWAEEREHLEVALQFAELAARLDPDGADRAATAGRLCRRRREMPRGTMWFQRSLRQATRQNHLINKAIARLGWSALERDLGRLKEAEKHAIKGFRAAMRAGRRSLAASAAHEIMAALAYQERYDEAWLHARSAITMYKLTHPRFPVLAHDVAVLWMRLGYFSNALPVIERIMPWMQRADDHALGVANLARASAACGDRIRYERAIREFVELSQSEPLIPPSAVYHAARAAQTAQDWPRADELARLVQATASDKNKPAARSLHQQIRARIPGDVDRIPDLDSDFDTFRESLLKKLSRCAATAPPPAAPPPENYPMG
jgi:tetratricopeptide (TPR) repeat protein